MSVTLLAAIALAQSAPAPAVSQIEQVDVAYDALAAGRPAVAIAKIEANHDLDANDPAALINAGTAYARLGRLEDARQSFAAAMASRQHYYLELADGRWMDSREAARQAMTGLETRLEIARR